MVPDGRPAGPGDDGRALHLAGPGVRSREAAAASPWSSACSAWRSRSSSSRPASSSSAGPEGSSSSLKEREESGQAALAAVDRMRIDLLHAGTRPRPKRPASGSSSPSEAIRRGAADRSPREDASRSPPTPRPARPGSSLVSTADIAAGQADLAARRARRERSGPSPGRRGGGRPRRPARAPATRPRTAVLSLLENVTYFRGRDDPGSCAGASTPRPPSRSSTNAAAAAWAHDPEARLVRRPHRDSPSKEPTPMARPCFSRTRRWPRTD
ncbi:MAG: hypothetical protein MZU84_09100 [Sphingobacterium sp.]|nr:hypothetical protein [Sphingobacterium sp.]